MDWKLKWMIEFDTQWDALSPLERVRIWGEANRRADGNLDALQGAAFYYALREAMESVVLVTDAGAQEYEEAMLAQEAMEREP